MTLRPMYDDVMIEEMAQDLSEQIILSGGMTDPMEQYKGMARKLYAAGWRRADESSGADLVSGLTDIIRSYQHPDLDADGLAHHIIDQLTDRNSERSG